MKISTKGIYALEIITDLAMHTEDGELESLGDSKEHNTPFHRNRAY